MQTLPQESKVILVNQPGQRSNARRTLAATQLTQPRTKGQRMKGTDLVRPQRSRSELDSMTVTIRIRLTTSTDLVRPQRSRSELDSMTVTRTFRYTPREVALSEMV